MDRSKFKASSMSAVKKSDEAINTSLGRKDRVQRAGFFTLKDGKNYFRFYPPHPGDELFAYPSVKAMMPVYVQDKDTQGNLLWNDKQKTIPKMRRSVRGVFNARIHGKEGDVDIIEAYIAYVRKIAENIENEADKKEYLAPIDGSYIGNKNPKNKMGIGFKETWVAYVNLIDPNDSSPEKQEFGRLEIGKAIKFRLNDLSATEESDEPIETDPFTDPEDGRAVVITCNKSATQPADFYKCDFYTPLIKGQGGMVRLYPLSDEQLDAFEKQLSLKSLFHEVYSRKDFELALEGLKILDEEEGFKIFEDDEFLEQVEAISYQYPEKDDKTPEDKEDEANLPFDKGGKSKTPEAQKMKESMNKMVNETDPDADDDMFEGAVKKGHTPPPIRETPTKEEIKKQVAANNVTPKTEMSIEDKKAKAAGILANIRNKQS